MRPTTYLLLMMLIITMWFAGMVWFAPEAEGAGGVRGGPYWNKRVAREQRQDRAYLQDLRQQETTREHLNTQHSRNQLQQHQRIKIRTRQTATPQYKYHRVKPATSSGWNYRRANEK